MSQVYIYDTTLRDGSQREGISYSSDDKLKIAKKLDEFGVHYIEGGWPGSNPKDAEFFQNVKKLKLNAKIAAFGSTRYKNTTCATDGNTQALVKAETAVVTLVGKSWDFHVTAVIETTLEENLAMIEESVSYFKALGKEVIYDGEHFFDGFKANKTHAMDTIKAAEKGGADTIVLCDTNGGTLPWEINEIVTEVKKHINTPIGIHTHDDGGCGVANSLQAIAAGAIHIQGTINGYGERVANADLTQVVPNIMLKMGKKAVSQDQLKSLMDISRFVAEVANLPMDDHQPFVGKSAFAHKGGIHVAAMLKAEETYQHIDPALVGNKKRMVVSELSGKGNLLHHAVESGIDLQTTHAKEILTEIKKLEYEGFTFEAAEASVNLLMHRSSPDYKAPFELIDFMVVDEQREGGSILSEAMVKVRIGQSVKHTAAEGNGPVNALDMALRKALYDDFPELKSVHLTDYKVRILNSEKGTGATTRVLIDFHNEDTSWTTVGAHSSIIEASWVALSDSMEYALTLASQG